MDDLGLDRNGKPSYDVDASIHNPQNKSFGPIRVTFNCNWHSGDGPYIEMDDTIKGYGIQHTSFKPRWSKFSYDKDKKELNLENNGYRFVLHL